MRIVVADQLPASALDLLRAEPGWIVDARAGRDPQTLAADLSGADALVVRSATTVDERLLDAAPGLKVVAHVAQPSTNNVNGTSHRSL